MPKISWTTIATGGRVGLLSLTFMMVMMLMINDLKIEIEWPPWLCTATELQTLDPTSRIQITWQTPLTSTNTNIDLKQSIAFRFYEYESNLRNLDSKSNIITSYKPESRFLNLRRFVSRIPNRTLSISNGSEYRSRFGFVFGLWTICTPLNWQGKLKPNITDQINLLP